MNKTLIKLVALSLLIPVYSFAQDVGGKTLVSQSRTTIANIGKCEITIKYHSPSVSGRKIFGGIVPYDFVVDGVEYPWRAGSNQRTTIEFSHDVTINGLALSAGSYGFLALVNEQEWTLIFSSGKSWGAFNYDPANDVLRVPVKTQNKSYQEWLSYDFVNPGQEDIDVQLRWENTAVVFNVKTNALQNTLSDLNKKEAKNCGDYQQMAIRILEVDASQTDQALEYLQQSYQLIDSIENEGHQQYYRFAHNILKGELLLSLGQKKEGQDLIDKAMNQGEGFNIYYYALRKYTVEGNKDQALKILQQGVKMYPMNFQNHFAFGEYYLKEGNQQLATEHFKKAYQLAQEQGAWINYARYLYLQNKLALESM